MVSKILADDPGCDLDVSLAWAVAARNALSTFLGYSPNQLVFGQNPGIPGAFYDNLPALDGEDTPAVSNEEDVSQSNTSALRVPSVRGDVKLGFGDSDMDSDDDDHPGEIVDVVGEGSQVAVDGHNGDVRQMDTGASASGLLANPVVRVKAGQRIKGVEKASGECISGRIVSRAGKATGRYSNCYNIKSDKDGNINWMDLDRDFTSWETVDEVTEMFVLFNTDEVVCAKEKEIENWRTKEVCEEVENVGQQAISVGSFDSECFKYVGLNVVTTEDGGITIDQFRYGASLNPVALSKRRALEKTSDLSEREKTEYRGLVGQLNWMATHTRPDIAFDVCELSVSIPKATVSDILRLNKVIERVKTDNVGLFIPRIRPLDECYSDASFANLQGYGSQGGFIIFLCDTNNVRGPIYWQSRKVRRVVNSTLAAETLALLDGASTAVYVASILQEISGCGRIPTRCFVDNRSVVEALYTYKLVDNKRLRIDISVLRGMLDQGELKEVTWVETSKQLADCLTKKIKHDTTALVWEWLPVEIHLINTEASMVSDITINLGLHSSSHSNLEHARLTDGLFELGYGADVFPLQILLDHVPEVLNWVEVRAVTWPILYEGYHAVIKPLSGRFGSVSRSTVLLKHTGTCELERIWQMFTKQLQIIGLKDQSIIGGIRRGARRLTNPMTPLPGVTTCESPCRLLSHTKQLSTRNINLPQP
ncbi:Retrovirus-related Pol polyprotein from transposon RE1 [Chionoecetes opilio]|uniref:Retrovirus-related Pol polyprotein from transposon RE1 n=1 Tax=Chionoecetes opilio TaxID=41210 RepID=A0A8J5CXM1_CHIOP|nr:Retrovirus-related Pol polyprotein from transposon RE1 [Chionoecetes opilio]